MSLERYGREFGDGRVMVTPTLEEFFEQSKVEQAKQLGWSDACPVVQSLLSTREPSELASRYAQVNFWYSFILEKVGRDSNIAAEISGPIQRQENEPLGKRDEGYVPSESGAYMIGVGTPYGYALPRTLLEHIGTDEGEKKERVLEAMKCLDTAISSSKTASELLVNFGEALVSAGANPKQLLKHIVSTGKIKEDNCFSVYNQIFEAMKKSAPSLWSIYSTLTISEKEALHIY
jgi:hypothetical protein